MATGKEAFSQDVTLTMQPGLEGYEYYRDDSSRLTVPEGVTLTVQAGVTMLMPQHGILIVGGHLWAAGKANNVAHFVSVPEVVANGDEWQGVVFGENGSGLMTYSEIQDAGVGVGIFGANGGEVAISDSKISNNRFGGVSTPDALHRLQMSNVTFEDNEWNRIGLEVADGFEMFSQDVTLTAQPGLEGYEAIDDFARIVVPEGVVLTMEPSTTFFFTETVSLQVEGALHLEGTAVHPATLTSLDESSSWKGVLLTGNGMMTSDYGEIARAETAVSIISPTATLSMTHSAISQNGVGILANEGTVTMRCTAVTDNNVGIHIESGTNPAFDVQQNNISGNMIAGIDNESGSQIDVRANWWGDVSGPSGIGSGSGDAAMGNLLYDPWLAEYECADAYATFLPFVINP